MGEAEDEGGVVPSSTEILALHLVRAIYDATDGQPQGWRSLAGALLQ